MAISPEQIAAVIESPYQDAVPLWEDLPGDPLQRVMLLRKTFPKDTVPVVLELSELRNRARVKLPHSEKLFFDREALEQCSSYQIALLRASAFQDCQSVADLTCGLGSDAGALATYCRVMASDISEARVAMSRWNTRILCGEDWDRITFGTAAAQDYPDSEGYFLDPSRRVSGRRSKHLRDLSPPVELIHELSRKSAYVGVKLSAATPDEELATIGGSVDFISSGGVCREAFVRLGKLSPGGRRALFARHGRGESQDGRPGVVHWEALMADSGTPSPPLSPPLKYLLEPDAAITRAGLLAELCHKINAARLDPKSAYVTADHPAPRPFAASYEILRSLPFSQKTVRAALRELEIGRLEVKKRGVALDVDEVRKRLTSSLPGHGAVVLMPVGQKPWAFICRPLLVTCPER